MSLFTSVRIVPLVIENEIRYYTYSTSRRKYSTPPTPRNLIHNTLLEFSFSQKDFNNALDKKFLALHPGNTMAKSSSYILDTDKNLVGIVCETGIDDNLDTIFTLEILDLDFLTYLATFTICLECMEIVTKFEKINLLPDFLSKISKTDLEAAKNMAVHLF